ncbi:MAG: VPA1269 family protein [Methylotenera sp.]|nr:VPA1269 family protein [Methylotenera sp.]MDP3094007.1 VPA1269 family protein [Methylotenera sp.]
MDKSLTKAIRGWKYSYDELKAECKRLGIKNSVDYKKRYQLYDGFPAHPERTYQADWISYNDFFDIPQFISYHELKKIVNRENIDSQKTYKIFINRLNDPTFPFDPQGVYQSEWESWFRFLGKEEPFKTKFIHQDYQEWALKIDEFMKIAKGGESKLSHLCRFVRVYIERIDKSKSPRELLTKEKVDVRAFRVVVDSFSAKNIQRKMVVAVNEFLDYVIDNELTIEDEETGEIERVLNARNPFSLVPTNQFESSTSNETTKPYLQYHFVKKAQDWIIPKGAKTFRDLTHLQKYDADWVQVDQSKIDKTDPNCVYKKTGNQYFLWVPTDWVHLYALTKIPLRGVQIAYNDSGEADDYIADLNDLRQVVWIKNPSPFAGMTKKQSFIMQMVEDGQIGTFVTTNKTKNDGKAYSIPWMPEELAYWLILLRKWQQKYNPISAPTSWSDCKRTNFNEVQLKAKGINCFLFRAFNDFEPKNVQIALAPRLAATLYNIQPSNLKLASMGKNPASLSNYESKYTPHSMRVSLITAYIMEMGMPVEIVMKIVGHSSVVMTIYYCKVSNSDIRQKLEEGEKIALQTQVIATQKIIEQNRIEEVKNNLVAANSDLLNALSNNIPAGNFVFRDFGICPYAASRCEDGGDFIGATQVRTPVSSGYLGAQNCIRCRHFVTGPAYLGGLLSITNEILLQANIQTEKCNELQQKIKTISDRLNALDREEYLANIRGEKFNPQERGALESSERTLESDYENAAMKLDVYLCDVQAAYKLIKLCQNIINKNNTDHNPDEGQFSLVATNESDLQIELEETSYFQQLQEVCENATIYQSASAHNATLPRTQLLDRMAYINDIAPQMFLLSESAQLQAGNEMFKLLKSRLKTWEKIDKVIQGQVLLNHLSDDEKILPVEIKFITNIENKSLGGNYESN